MIIIENKNNIDVCSRVYDYSNKIQLLKNILIGPQFNNNIHISKYNFVGLTNTYKEFFFN